MLSPVNVSIESLNLMTLVPMLIPIVGALLIIVIDLFKSDQHKSLYVMLSLLVLGVDFVALLDSAGIFEKNGTVMGVLDVMLIDGLAILSQFIMSLIVSHILIPRLSIYRSGYLTISTSVRRLKPSRTILPASAITF